MAPGSDGRRFGERKKGGERTVSKIAGGSPARNAWLVVAGLVALMLAIAGCGGSDNGGGGGTELQKVGKPEGELDLVNWPGYVEPQWTKPFEKETGCQVKNKDAGTSDEMVQLMRTG